CRDSSLVATGRSSCFLGLVWRDTDMEVEVTALHLLAASIAGFLPFLLGVRPLYTILVAVRFHSNDVMYQWRFPKKLWDKQVRGKKTFVGIVLAFSVVGTVW